MKEKIIEKIEQYVEGLLQKPELTQEDVSMLTYWLGKLELDERQREMTEKSIRMAAMAMGGGCCEL